MPSLADGPAVCLEQGVVDRDSKGRLPRFVWLTDDRLLDLELVRRGGSKPVLK
jgi:hypothetical protein